MLGTTPAAQEPTPAPKPEVPPVYRVETLVAAIDGFLTGVERGREGAAVDPMQLCLDARAVEQCLDALTGAISAEKDWVLNGMGLLPKFPLMAVSNSLSAASESGAEGLLIAQGPKIPSQIARGPEALRQYLLQDFHVGEAEELLLQLRVRVA